MNEAEQVPKPSIDCMFLHQTIWIERDVRIYYCPRCNTEFYY